MGLPRNDVVFRLWQCDKENHGWREGPPLTVPCQSFDLLAGPSPSRQNQFRTKKEYSFALLAAMQSKRTKIAYLKRMLKRLESEDTRFQNLVSGGDLTRQAAELALHQLNRNRDELLAELRKLELGNPTC